ncbi:RICIN domain-containing protein [Actinoallomurus iriomotensis]|uniref:Ricin B lectin domain-containing protein n=1 Tax=Actinoallomurus iriomotensis TaxID=478107 RepID=A0A9W6S3S8_9ACTN|nr:RICIN domain-containing protein [Actinoallomurus iriomotensis]GLY84865.1 hypothetical protein Airi02_027940 [Actinoallomurus iriomotensis]
MYTSEFAFLIPGYTTLLSSDSRLALTVRRGSLDENAPLIQDEFADLLQQWFRCDPLPGGYYRIMAAHSGMALTVGGDDPFRRSAPIVQRSWTGAVEQQFGIGSPDGVRLKVVPRLRNDFSLDVQGGSHRPGAEVIQYPFGTGQPNQLWYEGTPLFNQGTGRVADIKGGSTRDGAEVIQYRFQGGSNQVFYVEWVRERFYRVVARNGTFLAWTMEPTGYAASAVLMRPYTGAGNQLFTFERMSAGRTRIVCLRNGLAVQPESSTGQFLVGRSPGPEPLQNWRLQVSTPVFG